MDSRPRAADNRRPPGNREGAVKLGYFHNGYFPPIEFEDFVRWGAANGYQAIDVPLFEPNARAICDRHGLEPTSTVGMACQPIAPDPDQRAEEVAQARRALDYAAAEHIPNVWLGHEMAPDLGFDENVRLFAEGVAPVLDHAQRVGVRLVMENWANGGRNLAYAPAHWAAIFDAVPHPALGLCPDPSHLAWLGIDYLRAVREFGSRVYHAHAKDTEFCRKRCTSTASSARSADASARAPTAFGSRDSAWSIGPATSPPCSRSATTVHWSSSTRMRSGAPKPTPNTRSTAWCWPSASCRRYWSDTPASSMRFRRLVGTSAHGARSR